jgi:DNA-binding GntR family transcriptional regulator
MNSSNKIIKPSTIKEQVYNMLKEQILDGTIKPGEWLQEKKLAEMFNVSRSPVREVLIELVGEGLLENIPNKGVFVKVLNSKDIYNIFELREILEQYAIKKAVELATEDDVKVLKAVYKQLEESYNNGDVNEYSKVDTIIHNTIFSISGNDMLEDIVKNLYPQIQSFRTISLFNKKRYEESFIEHKGLIEGIIEKDYEKAWRHDSIHLKLARDEILKHIESLGQSEIK